MAKLLNVTRGNEVVANVRLARTFLERTLGLMGQAALPPSETLWIQGSRFIPCNSIHTFFMRFTIDVVFVDRSLKVVAVHRDLKPWRATLPVSGAWSVFEFTSGSFSDVGVGDQLHVGA